MGNENNNLNVRSFELEFKSFLQAVFGVQSYFGDFFAGGLEALDGVQENETAFYVKTTDMPVVFGDEYNKDKNVGFGTGTGNSSRFGERQEVIYTNMPANYTWEWVFHEGLDKHTVNNNFDEAMADRLDLQAQAKIKKFNRQHSLFIAKAAGREMQLADYSNENVWKLLNDANSYFVNAETVGERLLKVNTRLYAAIVDHPLVSTSKNSRVNIDNNELLKVKDFYVQELPDNAFAPGCVAYMYIRNVAKAFTGIVTTRTTPSEDFDGVAFQGAGKAGEFILDDNKKAVVKVTMGGTVDDAELSSLTIGGLAFTPTFSPGVKEYTANTTNATNAVNATPVSSGATAAITVNGTAVNNGGSATWNEGENTVVVEVTSGSASETYTVVVTKE